MHLVPPAVFISSHQDVFSASGSEFDPFDQRRLQGDAEVVEGLQDATEGVQGGPVPQQSAVLIRPSCQGTLGQQGEPLRQEFVPAETVTRFGGK